MFGVSLSRFHFSMGKKKNSPVISEEMLNAIYVHNVLYYLIFIQVFTCPPKDGFYPIPNVCTGSYYSCVNQVAYEMVMCLLVVQH